MHGNVDGSMSPRFWLRMWFSFVWCCRFCAHTLTVFAVLSLSYTGKLVVLGNDPVPHVNGCSSRAVAGMLLVGFILLSHLISALWLQPSPPAHQEWSVNTTLKHACLSATIPYLVTACLVVLAMGSQSASRWAAHCIQHAELATLQPSTFAVMVLLHLWADVCFHTLQAVVAQAFRMRMLALALATVFLGTLAHALKPCCVVLASLGLRLAKRACIWSAYVVACCMAALWASVLLAAVHQLCSMPVDPPITQATIWPPFVFQTLPTLMVGGGTNAHEEVRDWIVCLFYVCCRCT